MRSKEKNRRPAQPEAHGEDQARAPRKAAAMQEALTYTQLKRVARSLLHTLKSWLDAMAASNARRHGELKGEHSQMMKLLLEVRDRISAPVRASAIPEADIEPSAADAPPPAEELSEEPPGPDIVKALGMSVNQYDEFLGNLRDLAQSCPRECFAGAFARETIAGIECMRADTVSLLAMNHVELIDSAERFDPSRHMPIAVCRRPEGAEGDGEVRRVGLVRRRDGSERIIKPASIVLYQDVKAQLTERG